MKYYLYILLLLLACSCKITRPPVQQISTTEIYVQTKDGKKYTGTSFNRTWGTFKKDVIQLDDTTFRTKDVAYYSNKGAVMANVGKYNFAKQIMVGPVNIYQLTQKQQQHGYSSRGRVVEYTGKDRLTTYFIQQKNSFTTHPLTYKNLIPMVDKTTPAYAMLQAARKNRTEARITDAAGIVVVGAACYLIIRNYNRGVAPGNNYIGNIGQEATYTFAVAGAIFVASASIHVAYMQKLIRAMYMVDGGK